MPVFMGILIVFILSGAGFMGYLIASGRFPGNNDSDEKTTISTLETESKKSFRKRRDESVFG